MTVLAAVAAFTAGGGVSFLASQRGAWRLRHKAPILVTLKTGEGFKGVLKASDRRTLVLADVEQADTALHVDGELIVQLADVRYAQRL